MQGRFLVVVLVAMSATVRAASLKLPAYLKPCSMSDPKLDECALKNGLEAIPTLLKGDDSMQIPVLDPLLLEQVKINEGTGGVRFTLTLNKALAYGLKYADVKQVRLDLKKRVVGVNLEIKGTKLHLLSRYVIDGKVLVLPIKGEGDFNLTLDNAKADVTLKYDLVKHADGQEYAKITDSDIDFDIGRAFFHFDNLFNGDKVLGDNMNVFLNENWLDVYNEVKPAVSEVLRTVVMNIISKIVDKVAFQDIFLP